MAMGRGLRAFHVNPAQSGGVYSIILEQRGRNDVLLFENYAVASIGKAFFASFGKSSCRKERYFAENVQNWEKFGMILQILIII